MFASDCKNISLAVRYWLASAVVVKLLHFGKSPPLGLTFNNVDWAISDTETTVGSFFSKINSEQIPL